MSRSIAQRRTASGCALMVAILLQACASLPPPAGKVPSQALTDVGQTRLGRFAQAPGGLPTHLDSGVRGLPNPLDAFAARVLLARTAERSLDVQYYIWNSDVTGHLLLDELFGAAERGVRVRLLVDDNGIGDLDAALAALSSHPNAEVRLFNPFARRGSGKALGYLYDFERLNHRMHNKSFTADASATIVGGRNVGDEYFGASEESLFADLDVIAFGKAARDVSAAFDLYWNSEQAYPVETVVASPSPDAVAATKARFAAVRSSDAAARYGESVVARVRDTIGASPASLEWVTTRLVYDEPIKAAGKAGRTDLLFTRLLQAMGNGRESLDLVSPYFVPGKDGTASLADRARSGIKVRIVTNSLASSDGISVHSGYARYREELLRAGVRIFELKPGAELEESVKKQEGSRFSGSSGSTLHAKTFSVDRERIFVGSFNLDQRSLFLNTEMGLVIQSPAMARALSEALDRDAKRSAFEVQLKDDGSGLVWIEHTERGLTRYDTEPMASFLRRLGVGVLSLFPIEWLL